MQVLGPGSRRRADRVLVRTRFPKRCASCPMGAGAVPWRPKQLRDRAGRRTSTTHHSMWTASVEETPYAPASLARSSRGDLSYALRCGVALAGPSQTYRGDSGWVTQAQLEACVHVLRLGDRHHHSDAERQWKREEEETVQRASGQIRVIGVALVTVALVASACGTGTASTTTAGADSGHHRGRRRRHDGGDGEGSIAFSSRV